MKIQFVLGPALVLALTSLTGCGFIKKTQECKAVVDTINAGVVKLKASDEPGGGDPKKEAASLKKRADTFDAIVADVKKVTVSVDELKTLTDEYVKLLQDASKAAREIAAAYEKSDLAKTRAGIESFNKVVHDEEAVVAKINKVCSGQ